VMRPTPCTTCRRSDRCCLGLPTREGGVPTGGVADWARGVSPPKAEARMGRASAIRRSSLCGRGTFVLKVSALRAPSLSDPTDCSVSRPVWTGTGRSGPHAATDERSGRDHLGPRAARGLQSSLREGEHSRGLRRRCCRCLDAVASTRVVLTPICRPNERPEPERGRAS
jgi:hypothetical protein